jgi:hypothetical protein
LINNIKKCPYCGSSSTLPIAYGYISDEIHQENNENKKWAWGGCVIREGHNTDHCTKCAKSFGGDPVSNKTESDSYDETLFIKNREKLFIKLDKYLDEPRDEELYTKALIEAEGDEVEAGHIYYGLFMQSISDDET